ncbi:hypothetical protein CDV31_017199, partial [Fusarium ambrosium]
NLNLNLNLLEGAYIVVRVLEVSQPNTYTTQLEPSFDNVSPMASTQDLELQLQQLQAQLQQSLQQQEQLREQQQIILRQQEQISLRLQEPLPQQHQELLQQQLANPAPRTASPRRPPRTHNGRGTRKSEPKWNNRSRTSRDCLVDAVTGGLRRASLK